MDLQQKVRLCIDELRKGFCVQNFSCEITESEYRVILFITKALKNDERINMTDLSKRLGVTRSAVTQLVNKLCQKNCIIKYSLPTNKKEVYLELSGEAKSQYDRIAGIFDRFYEKLHNRIGDDGERHLIYIINCANLIVKEIQEEEKRKCLV